MKATITTKIHNSTMKYSKNTKHIPDKFTFHDFSTQIAYTLVHPGYELADLRNSRQSLKIGDFVSMTNPITGPTQAKIVLMKITKEITLIYAEHHDGKTYLMFDLSNKSITQAAFQNLALGDV